MESSLCVLNLAAYAIGVTKKPLLNSRTQRFILKFSCNSFIALALNIYIFDIFELIKQVLRCNLKY